jgi:hypothetical protein
MAEIIDFPGLSSPEDMELLTDIIDSGKFQDCHDKLFANYNVSDIPPQKLFMGFYLYGYLQAAYDSNEKG